MKKYFLILLLAFSFFSCKKDLNGHWHSKGLENYEYRLDIENDSLCFMISSLYSEPSNGKHFGNEKKIEIYAQACGIYDFYYEIKNGNVYIKNSLGKKIILERKQNCDKIGDYKTELKIDFLKIKNIKKDSVYNFRHNLNEYINIGFSKENKTLLIESWKLEGLQTLKSFDSLTYKFEEYYTKEETPFINYIITPDKKLKARDLNKILKSLSKNKSKNVYIRTLKNRFLSTERNIFDYVNINFKKNRFDFDSNKSLDEIIN
ncbi:hypothetical protein [Tenacibaculum sp. nBUS_03]|uniref:hypothetical protein n=1 Tax=Tenacibaculum sp. nBUS_03 TaxID=3395320 RepID=UPI003EB821A0